MTTKEFKIKKQGNYFVAFDSINDKISYGRINIKTGQCIGGTHCFEALRNHLESKRPTVVKKSYKIWVVIEEQTTFSDGSEEFKDLEDNTQSGGHFDTLEEAESVLAEINANYEGDFRNQ